MVDCKGVHFQKYIVLTGVRWLAHPVGYWYLEEMMEERGTSVDHSIINRWVVKFTPQIEAVFSRRKRPHMGRFRFCLRPINNS